MASKFGEEWARQYAAHVAMAALGTVVVLRSIVPGKRDGEELVWFLAGLVVIAVVVCLTAISTGSSPGGLIDGVVLQPLRQGDAFTSPFRLADRSWLLNLIALGGAFGYFYGSRGRGTALGAAWIPALSLFSIMVGLEMGLSVIGKALPFDQGNVAGYSLTMLGFAWVALIPLSEESAKGTNFARLLVPPLAVMQALHAFPVAGSQIAWASFLLAPTAAICVAGGVRGLARSIGDQRQLRGLAVAGMVAAASLSVYLVNVTLRDPLREARAVYHGLESLGLPGSSRIHLGQPEATVYRQVTAAIDANCPALAMLPGMDSFYLWSQQEPPTGLNTTTWPTLFDDARQRRVVDEIRSIRGLCLLEDLEQAEIWSGGPVPDTPLVNYLHRGFRPLTTVGPYRLLQRPVAVTGQS
jgi:hypothetical protein